MGTKVSIQPKILTEKGMRLRRKGRKFMRYSSAGSRKKRNNCQSFVRFLEISMDDKRLNNLFVQMLNQLINASLSAKLSRQCVFCCFPRDDHYLPIHRDAPTLFDLATGKEILATGIKVIEVLLQAVEVCLS